MHRAIETRYAGYRFRSRLEARYAILFDTLEIKWDYEPEGFDLPSGPYLPDFWLKRVDDPAQGYWVEIKPLPPTPLERQRMLELCEATGHLGWFFWGTPSWEAFGMPHDGTPETLGFAYPLDVNACAGQRNFDAGCDAARSARFGKGGRG